MNKPSHNYDELQQLLDDNHLLITVAELQGLLMGFYAAGLDLNDLSWKANLLKQLSTTEPVPDVIDTELTRINGELREMISTELFGLELLLPPDESSAVARAEAMGYWCQGFLLGYLQLTENKEESDEDVDDALSDLEEISNLDLDTVGSTEEDEKSLFELAEHIKVSAQIIHSVNGQSPAQEDETLH
ncbi:MAG: hypothetical protein COA74_05650 [Gammaproteobacteria bacterium]|nr:MAG: hypothetical protein COA74_05650 [Gammaproteobacteria bacterium]